MMIRSDCGDPARVLDELAEMKLRSIVDQLNFGRAWGNFENAYCLAGGKMFEYALINSIPVQRAASR